MNTKELRKKFEVWVVITFGEAIQQRLNNFNSKDGYKDQDVNFMWQAFVGGLQSADTSVYYIEYSAAKSGWCVYKYTKGQISRSIKQAGPYHIQSSAILERDRLNNEE